MSSSKDESVSAVVSTSSKQTQADFDNAIAELADNQNDALWLKYDDCKQELEQCLAHRDHIRRDYVKCISHAKDLKAEVVFHKSKVEEVKSKLLHETTEKNKLIKEVKVLRQQRTSANVSILKRAVESKDETIKVYSF